VQTKGRIWPCYLSVYRPILKYPLLHLILWKQIRCMYTHTRARAHTHTHTHTHTHIFAYAPMTRTHEVSSRSVSLHPPLLDSMRRGVESKDGSGDEFAAHDSVNTGFHPDRIQIENMFTPRKHSEEHTLRTPSMRSSCTLPRHFLISTCVFNAEFHFNYIRVYIFDFMIYFMIYFRYRWFRK